MSVLGEAVTALSHLRPGDVCVSLLAYHLFMWGIFVSLLGHSLYMGDVCVSLLACCLYTCGASTCLCSPTTC